PLQHFTFTSGKRGQTLRQLRFFDVTRARLVSLAERQLHGSQKYIIVVRLLEKINGSNSHRFDCERDVAMSGNDNHRDTGIHLAQSPQEVDAADVRHSHVGDDAASRENWNVLEKYLGRVVGTHFELGAAQQKFQRFARRVVI